MSPRPHLPEPMAMTAALGVCLGACASFQDGIPRGALAVVTETSLDIPAASDASCGEGACP